MDWETGCVGARAKDPQVSGLGYELCIVGLGSRRRNSVLSFWNSSLWRYQGTIPGGLEGLALCGH